ncbi:nucleolus protein [Fennellomyces sp. T-0311]|nr:nucleolus protein [Fennellomyces sp. T-0311]
MPKARKKVPITQRAEPTLKKFKQSSAETARLIRRFHVLNKELAKCKTAADSTRKQSILAEMEAMGGIDWYQRASQLGQSKRRGGDSSKWLLQVMAKHHLKKNPTKILEVGAVAPDNYDRHKSWIQVKPIDLNPQDPRIEKQDFLEMIPTSKFDIVSLSLVVNFVGDPRDRGRMLLHTRDFLDPDGYLFLVLPLPCIDNSRYMSHEHLMSMMQSMGYGHCVEHHFSNKLAYYLFQLTSEKAKCRSFKKEILTDGAKRNNFAIIIDT